MKWKSFTDKLTKLTQGEMENLDRLIIKETERGFTFLPKNA